MFEKYTEKARRVIFFARYEASQFGNPLIETEHLLLGLIREDKTLTSRFIPKSGASIESIRKEIEGRTSSGKRSPHPSNSLLRREQAGLERRCRGVGAARPQAHRHRTRAAGPPARGKIVAAEILRERGLRLAAVREELARGAAEKHAAGRSKEPLSLLEFSRDLTEAASATTSWTRWSAATNEIEQWSRSCAAGPRTIRRLSGAVSAKRRSSRASPSASVHAGCPLSWR